MNERPIDPERDFQIAAMQRDFRRQPDSRAVSSLSSALFIGVLVVCMLISGFLRFIGPSSIPQRHHSSKTAIFGQ